MLPRPPVASVIANQGQIPGCDHPEIYLVKHHDASYPLVLGLDSDHHVSNRNRDGALILVGYLCTACPKLNPRPSGLPSEVCYLCGGKMRLIKERHQCSDPNCRDIYECQECHRYYVGASYQGRFLPKLTLVH